MARARMHDASPCGVNFDARLVEGILLLVAVEAIVLVAWLARNRAGVRAADFLWNLGAGAGLLAALLAVLSDAAWWWVASALLLAGCAHAVDLWRRLRGSGAVKPGAAAATRTRSTPRD
jgi:hypothetical protein